MRYIPRSVVIRPNQISMRLMPELNPKLTYILENIRPIKVIENEKEYRKLKYVFTEHKSPNDYTIKDPNTLHRVEIVFDDYSKADNLINKILGIREENRQDFNEYDPNANLAERAEIRRNLNDVANRQFNRRPAR